MSEQCEVCGEYVDQLQVDRKTDELTGPWYESRHHRRGNIYHDWMQIHNCVKPQPDDCQFCREEVAYFHP